MTPKTLEKLMPWAVTVGFVVLWELSCLIFDLDIFILPAPSDVLRESIEFAPQLAHHALYTLYTTLVGFGLAVVVGVLLGAAIGSSRLVYRGLYPVLIGFNSGARVLAVGLMIVFSIIVFALVRRGSRAVE